jgi:uncharacterized membrane protein
MADSTSELPFVAPCRALSIDAPLRWLRLGWRDLRAAPIQSLTYGSAIFATSALVSSIAWRFGSGWMLIVMLSSFVFVAPVLALGHYAISSELDRGKRPSPRSILLAERSRLSDALVYSLVLLVICLVWMRAGTAVQIA